MDKETEEQLRHLLWTYGGSYYDECEYGEVFEGGLTSDELEEKIIEFVNGLLKGVK